MICTNNERLKFKSFANYCFLIYCCVWEVVGTFILNIDGYGRFGMILLGIAIVSNFWYSDVWRKLRIPAIAFWGIWVIIEYLNWSQVGLMDRSYPDSWYFIYYNFIKSFAALLITVVEFKRNSKRLIWVLLYSLAFYVLLGVIFQFRMGEGMRGSDASKLGNSLPLVSLAMVATGMISYKFIVIPKKIIYMIFALSVFTIMSCATRKAFMAVIILFIAWYIATTNFKDTKNLFVVILGCCLAYAAFFILMEYTTLGERFSEVSEQSGKYENNLFLKAMGDRAIQYVLAWPLFMKSPIFGVGLVNFQHHTGYFVRLHTEYMVQLAECGLVGFILYLSFIISIIKNLIKLKKVHKSLAILCLGWMGSLLFVSFTTWVYDFTQYFIVTGLVIGCYANNRIVKDKIR